MSAETFTYDVFLSASAKDKAVVRPHPKAECRRQNAEALPSAFFLHPFLNGSLVQFLYINWRQADREQEYAKLAWRTEPATNFAA
jgi:hypothetical protein